MSESRITYFAGLDLGQVADRTAISVVERTATTGQPSRYAVRFLRRWPVGSGYPEIVGDVRNLFEREPLTGGTLVVDASGVGRPICDLLDRAGLKARSIIRLTITAGSAVSAPGREIHVAKVHLAGVLQTLLGNERLVIAPQLAEAKTLESELRSFVIKLRPSGTETFEALGSSQHDDTVLATAIACWVGESNTIPGGWVKSDRLPGDFGGMGTAEPDRGPWPGTSGGWPGLDPGGRSTFWDRVQVGRGGRTW